MRKALVANTNGTLVVNPMDSEYFSEKYQEKYGVGDLLLRNLNNEKMQHIRELQKKLRVKDSLYPHVENLLMSVKESGFGILIYANAHPEKTREIYGQLHISIDSAYTTHDSERSSPEAFRQIRKNMNSDGFEPVAYLTDRPPHALASAEAWGRGLLCRTESSPDSRIYAFEWEDLHPEDIRKIIKFLEG
jgi:FMN phosphatase YigB (HAD superfamily)